MAVNQFNNTSSKDGLVQKCEQELFGDNGFGKISDNTNLKYIFANFANEALDWYGQIARKYSRPWKFDSSTYTTFPEGTTDLNANQPDYTLNIAFLGVFTVEVRDPSNSRWIKLNKITDDDIKALGYSPSEYASTAGIPSEYKLVGNSIILLPKPNYDVADGLKVTIERGFQYFTYDDTTDTIGIPLEHARYISDYMSWLYARSRTMPDKRNDLEKRVLKYEQIEIPDYYSSRSKDDAPIMRPKVDNTQ